MVYDILIVDDEEHVRQGIKILLQWGKFKFSKILEATSGQEGLILLNNKQIVLVDINMPEMTGIQFIEKAKKLYPNNQYVIISGFDEFTYAKEAIKLKVLNYLLKPVDREELNTTMTMAIDKLVAENKDILDETYDFVANKDQNDIDSNLINVKEYIDNNYYEKLNLNIFEKQYHLNKDYLSKMFKKKFGFTIYDYILKIRMEKAKELLYQSKVKTTDIYSMVGYSEYNYFSKAFRKYWGVSPNKYKEALGTYEKS